MKYYYIVNNVGSKINDLPAGPRIFHMQFVVEFKEGDGPFNSIKELRKNSTLFKKLQRENPQRAQKIYEKRFIIKAIDFVLASDSIENDLNGYTYKILDHILSGDIKNKKGHGVHYFNPIHHKILELTKAKNSRGVWEAKIAFLNNKTQKWVEKEAASTFFPTEWNKTELLHKIHSAFNNKEKITETKFIGETNCGIRVVFIFREEKLLSIYPLYD